VASLESPLSWSLSFVGTRGGACPTAVVVAVDPDEPADAAEPDPDRPDTSLPELCSCADDVVIPIDAAKVLAKSAGSAVIATGAAGGEGVRSSSNSSWPVSKD
jgi:hypothetical protein